MRVCPHEVLRFGLPTIDVMYTAGMAQALPQSPESTRVLMREASSGVLRPFSEDVKVTISSRGAPWEDALVMEVDEVQPGEMNNYLPVSPIIVLHLDGSSGTVERIGKRSAFESLPSHAGIVDIDPAGARTSVRWDKPHSLLFLMPTNAIMQRAMASMHGTSDFELQRVNHVHDPQIEQIGRAFMSECESGFASGQLFGESLALALVSRLMSRFSAHGLLSDSPTAKGLPVWRLRLVKQYVEDNLESNLCMADMAAVANMSEFHFSRLFKHSTGYTPYRYVVGRRVQRGRELLAKTSLPLNEVSEKLGFGDQSHFTTVFRKSVGMTPKQFRDCARL